MSSSLRAERRRAGIHAPRASAVLRAPRAWTLRTRLLVTQVLVLAVVCAGIGIATEFALQRFLMNQLDEQVVEAGRRSAVIFDFGPPPPGMGPHEMRPPDVMMGPPPRPGSRRRETIRDDEGPGPAFLNAPGQAIRTVGAVVSGGMVLDAGVITADGARAGISTAAAEQLAAVSVGMRPRTVDLDGLGRYRVVSFRAHHPGETVVAGLPTADVDDTLLWVLVIFCVVAAVALVAAATAGIVIVRRQLAPLARVSAAAPALKPWVDKDPHSVLRSAREPAFDRCA